MLTRSEKNQLQVLAEQIRLEALKSIVNYGRGHVGGAMSIADTLAVLYSMDMNVDPADPRMENRDRFVLSKGHAGPGLYAALALKGFFPIEELDTMNKENTILPSHCDMNKTPGVDMSSGALGIGLSAALGMALASRMRGMDYYTYAMIGDGECDEGQIWEAIMLASHQKADHLITFFDKNDKQLDGPTDSICALGDLSKKLEDFGWFVQTVDGHDVEAIHDAIQHAKSRSGAPNAIVLKTVKGYGCPNALKRPSCHALRYVTPKDRQEGLEDIAFLERKIERLRMEGSAD